MSVKYGLTGPYGYPAPNYLATLSAELTAVGVAPQAGGGGGVDNRSGGERR